MASAGTSRTRLVHDGQTVLDVPPKLSAQVRVFTTGNGRKTGPAGAHLVAMVALRSPGLVQVLVDDDLVVKGMLADRRDELGRARPAARRLHRLLRNCSTAVRSSSCPRGRPAMLATIQPRDLPGTTRRLAAELISELEVIDKKIKAIGKELTELVTARRSTLLELHGIGPSSAARLLADVGDIHRFAGRDKFASYRGPGTGGSTGRCTSWPSSSSGPRPPAGAYFDARKAGGMPSMMAMRALRRRLPAWSSPVCSPTRQREDAGPGGQPGTAADASVTDLTLDIGSPEKPHPGPPPSLERSSSDPLTQRDPS